MINKEKEKNIKVFYEEDEKEIYGHIAKALIVFALICLLTSLVFNTGCTVVKETISTPGSVGPITTTKRNTVFQINVKAHVSTNSWAFVSGEVLDSQKNYLFSFGQELWKERGVDYNGESWSESDVKYDIKVTLPKPGTYYIKFVSESGSSGYKPGTVDGPSIKTGVVITKKRGSSLPHMWVGILALILAIVFNEIKSQTIGKLIEGLT